MNIQIEHINNQAKKVAMALLLLFSLLASVTTYAKDLGKIGETYPIKETDIVEFIKNRLNAMQLNGKLTQINKEMIATVKQRMERPLPVPGITPTQKYRTWLINPSISFDRDILDSEGKVIIKRGTVVNPFKNTTLKKTYIFYDGDNKAQVAWVTRKIKKDKELQGKDKLILIKGSVVEQSNLLKKRIYFDQHGRLTSKFKITHTPACVSQEGMQFKVEELVP